MNVQMFSCNMFRCPLSIEHRFEKSEAEVETITAYVEVWVNAETREPGRLVWRGVRYVVVKRPIAIKAEAPYVLGAMHPTMMTVGWQLTVQSDVEERTLDLRRDGKRWLVSAVYD